MSHRLLQVDQELQIASSSHNLRIIQLLQSNATSEEEKSLVDDYYKEFLLHEGDLLRKRLAANKAQREQSSNASKPSQANNISTPIVALSTAKSDIGAASMVFTVESSEISSKCT